MVYETIGSSPVSWAGKTAPEIRDVGAEPGSVLVIPLGSIEQHGNHLPVSTDTLLVDAVATTGAERVADDLPVLVTPPIYPGYSPHHMAFGGTLTLEFQHMLEVVVDTAETGLTNGFDAVLVLNGHGGNIPLVGAATSIVGVEHSDATIFGMSYFQLAEPFIDEIRDSEPGGMGHAGELETSLMLHLRPELVADERSGTYLHDPHDLTINDLFDTGPLGAYRPFTEYSESGAIGDPDLATAEKGESILEGLQAELAAVLLGIHDEVS